VQLEVLYVAVKTVFTAAKCQVRFHILVRLQKASKCYQAGFQDAFSTHLWLAPAKSSIMFRLSAICRPRFSVVRVDENFTADFSANNRGVTAWRIQVGYLGPWGSTYQNCFVWTSFNISPSAGSRL